MSVNVNDCGNYVVIEFYEYINNGWAVTGCVRHKVNLNKEEVMSIVEKLSKWLKKQKDKDNEQ